MQAWHDFLAQQEKRLSKDVVDKWLRPFAIVHFDSANLYLEAKDSFQVEWFEEHIRPQLKTQLFNNNHRPIKVHISIAEEGALGPLAKSGKKGKSIPFSPPPLSLASDPIDSAATLPSFTANPLLLQFLQEILTEKIPLGAFNPIYLYGAAGTGKTHLLMALSQALNQKGVKALYVRSETFTDHVVNAIRTSEMQYFRNHYRHVDALIVDDVHIFARKAATQEEFFHTFNALHTAGKQIILSSHSLPAQLEEIEPRLISRFEWGITFHLEKLQPEEMRAVLLRRSQAFDFPLSPDVLDFLLDTFPPQPSSLNRALETLILRTHLEKQTPSLPLTLSQATRFLQELIEKEKENALTPQKIISAVASHFGIRSEDILGKSQTQECVLPRQIAMHLCRSSLHLPFMKIGTLFNKDHSTVMSSVRQVQTKLDHKDPELTQTLFALQKQLS